MEWLFLDIIFGVALLSCAVVIFVERNSHMRVNKKSRVKKGNHHHGKYRHASAAASRHSAYRASPGGGITVHSIATIFSNPYGTIAIDEAGIRAGEIIAWRGWRVNYWTTLDPCLMSLVQPFMWVPNGYYGARERYQSPNGVALNEATGFYSFKREEMMYHQLLSIEISNDMLILGQVKLWGEVIEHEEGWRSEFAKVHKITDVKGPHGYDRYQYMEVFKHLQQVYSWYSS